MLATEKIKRKPITLKAIFWIVGIIAAAADAWLNRFSLSSPDGVSYLDIADSYLRGDWHAAINAYWSPLYSWLLSAALFILKPSAQWEFAVVKGVNFFSFVIALACFEFLLRETVLYYRSSVDEDARLHKKTITACGYAIFLWTSLYWIGVRSDTPDLLTSAAVYAAVALILRMRRLREEISSFLWLGVVLAAGYFSKAVFFPLSLMLIIACFISLISKKRERVKVLLTVTIFLLLIAPWLIDLSRAKDHFTFGESGKLNYAWFVNPGFSSPNHWQGGGGTGIPHHPERKIFDDPPAFEFGAPVAGTYPPWSDPSYWFAGMSVKFSLQNHVRVLLKNLLFYYDHFLRFVILSLLIFVLIGGSVRSSAIAWFRNWLLWIPALAGLALYVSAKTHTSMRYISPFAGLLIFSILISFCFKSRRKKAFAEKLLFIVASLFAASALFLCFARNETKAVPPYFIASSFRQAGVRSGERIAIVGDEDNFVYWARLARVKIVAQVPDQNEFRKRMSSSGEIMNVLKSTGANTVVMLISDRKAPDHWQMIQGAPYVLHRFN